MAAKHQKLPVMQTLLAIEEKKIDQPNLWMKTIIDITTLGFKKINCLAVSNSSCLI